MPSEPLHPDRVTRPRVSVRRILRGLIPAIAMTFVAGMAVATTMPAVAFGESSDFGLAYSSLDAQSSDTQSLGANGEVVTPGVQRDDYVAVEPPKPTPTPTPKAPGSGSGSASVGGFACAIDPPAPTTRVTWPYPGPVPQSDGFGPRAEGFHKGVDMLGEPGSPINSIADGVVFATGNGGTGGTYTAVSHLINGVRICSMYMHFIEGSLTVEVGQVVAAGTVLGLTGDTGNATVEHLHFELYGQDNARFDPIAFLEQNASY